MILWCHFLYYPGRDLKILVLFGNLHDKYSLEFERADYFFRKWEKIGLFFLSMWSPLPLTSIMQYQTHNLLCTTLDTSQKLSA